MSKTSSIVSLRLFEKFAEDLMSTRGLKPYPIEEIKDLSDGRNIHVFVKREHDNIDGSDPIRSIKRKPANLMGLYVEEINPHARFWISASSGNFVEELGILANETGKDLFAVVPPRTPSQTLETLMNLGIHVVKVSEEEYDLCPREFTVFWVRAVVNKCNKILNVDQYSSILNPLAHLLMTAKEIDGELKDLTHIFIPLGSTGTFTGICEYFSRFHPKIKIIGVQPTREHHIPGVHYVMGDCKWSPEIFGLLDKRMLKVLTIDDSSAYMALMELEVKHGIHGGPSTGMVFAAVKQELNNIEDGSNVLILSADSSWEYGEWNKTILKRLRDESRFSEKESLLLEMYMKILEKRENSLRRMMKVKNIYKPSKMGQLYSLEEFEDLLPSLFR
ncbi:MAG: pyridoxal-phosphate dependent enzyme [Candidatus Bathyarchaeia archaeon]